MSNIKYVSNDKKDGNLEQLHMSSLSLGCGRNFLPLSFI